jgi:uncharacterized protein YkwD
VLKSGRSGADDARMTLRPASLGLAAAVCLATMLSACGGGGGDAADPAAGAAPPAPAPAPAPSPPPVASGPTPLSTCGLANYQARLIERVNALRAAGASCGSSGSFGAAGAVTWARLLDEAALAHSQDMAQNNYFSHTSLDGRTMSDRIDATGYAWRNVGENIAAGYGTVDAVMDGWIASPGHCANLMNPAFTEFAVACVPGAAGSTYGTYWTMNLARPR